MATIRTAIEIYDGMTRPLKSMHTAMNILINGFETMQRTSGNAIDVSAIQQAREELARAGTAFDQIEENIRRSTNSQRGFNQQINNGANSADTLLSKLKGIALTVGGLTAVKNIIGVSDTLTNTDARLNLLVDDGGSLSELEQKVMASAQRSRSAYFDTASAVAKLGLNAGNAFDHDNDQIIAFMEQVNKQFVIDGANAIEQSNAMIQLTQAMSAGALRGEELNSILDAAPSIARAIENYMGVAEGSIKQYAEQGLVTAEVVKNALFSVADETNANFESMPMTWSQVWTTMQNKALSVFSPILKQINDVANSERLNIVADGIINGLTGIANMAEFVFNLLGNGVAFIVDNWSWLAPVIYGVVGAFTIFSGVVATYNTVQGISNTLSAIATARSAIKAGATIAEAAATKTATGAQVGLNTAMLACPIVWIMILIIALIAVFYAVIAVINKFAGTTYSATGMVCGAVLVLVAIVGNTLIGLFNALIQFAWTILAQPFINVIEWILNVANGGFNSFGDAVANLIGQIIDWFLSLGQVVTRIIDAIFGTDWTGGLQSLRNNVVNWGKNEKAITVNRKSPTIEHRFEYGSAWEAGNKFGKGIEDKVSGLFDFNSKDIYGAGKNNSFANALDGIYNNTGDIAENTKQSADSIQMSNEELELLRNIAEREAINKFTTAEIKVEMHNNNKISSEMDLDGIINLFEVKLLEAVTTSAEGGHI